MSWTWVSVILCEVPVIRVLVIEGEGFDDKIPSDQVPVMGSNNGSLVTWF